MLTNVSCMKKSEVIGYKIVIRDLNTPHDIITNQTLKRYGSSKDLNENMERWNETRRKINSV